MLPVSGAEQLQRLGRDPRAAAGDLGQRRVLQVGQPGAVLVGRGRNRFHRPALARLAP